MNSYASQNKAAWEYNVYDFWVRDSGTPLELAQDICADPRKKLKRYAHYFDTFEGVRVANICGSCGKKAVPLALLGADVTVFDISRDNCRYALELAEAAHTTIHFEVCDILEIDLQKYGNFFDVVFFEGGVLHYFHDIHSLMNILHSLLRPGGKLIASDFHPYTKIMDILDFQMPVLGYFSTEVYNGEMAHARFFPEDIRKDMPLCSYRKYTVSEIINAVIHTGFVLEQFDEHPAWTDSRMPGEFTLIAHK